MCVGVGEVCVQKRSCLWGNIWKWSHCRIPCVWHGWRHYSRHYEDSNTDSPAIRYTDILEFLFINENCKYVLYPELSKLTTNSAALKNSPPAAHFVVTWQNGHPMSYIFRVCERRYNKVPTTQWREALKVAVFDHFAVVWRRVSRELLRIFTQALYRQNLESLVYTTATLLRDAGKLMLHVFTESLRISPQISYCQKLESLSNIFPLTTWVYF